MIFFNVPEAKKQLVERGLVYTLRSSFRATGRTRAVEGSYSFHTDLCMVDVSRVIPITDPIYLSPYLNLSGFDSVNTWWSKATPTARTLYKVEKVD